MIPFASIPSLALLAPVHWIVELLKPVLVFFHDSIGVGWGMSIVLLTVCVRALLAPLTVKQFKSMQAMVSVAPELKALQAKHKDDKQRQQQEVMKFYAENKINPFASCLPLVAQMPFFIGLFYLLRSDLRREICGRGIEQVGKLVPCGQIPHPTGNERFLFIPDLTVKANGWVLAVLIVLYVGSQLLSTVLTPSTADRNQRMLMYGLPFVFVVFVHTFPAGLIVYWITTNLWTVGQGYILRKRIGPIGAPRAEPALAGVRGAGSEVGGGGFMARLAAATGGASRDTAPEPRTARGGDGAASKSSAGRERAPAAGKERAPAAAGAKSNGGGRSRSSSKSSGSGAGSGSGTAAAPAKAARSGPPPPPPRKKKKRSGRRR
jgi:YidC/Oxa1 family membrane protein insertase